MKAFNQNTNFCPCGSQKLFNACCGLYISGNSLPSTPEKLMRSRYSAYVKGDLQYIQNTMRGEPKDHFDPEETQKFIDQVKWQSLRVIKNFQDDQDIHKAYVTFSAIYKQAGRLYEIRETSEFTQQKGIWYYTGEKTDHACGDHCGHDH